MIDEINTKQNPGCGGGVGGQYKKLVDKANELYETKEYYGAHELYQRALDLDPANPQSDLFKERISEIKKITEANQ